MNKKPFYFLITLITLSSFALQGQTIAEKKAQLTNKGVTDDSEMGQTLNQVNQTLEDLGDYLASLYSQGPALYQKGAEQEEYQELIAQITEVKQEMRQVQKLWQGEIAHSDAQEPYALMNASEILLSDFVNEYSNSQYIYLVPPEIASIRLNIQSNFPIPRQSWQECLETILDEYGLATREINPYLRQIYSTAMDYCGPKIITDSLDELACLPPKTRVCFIMNDQSDPRQTLRFLNKFSNPKTTQTKIFGGRLFIIASVDTIQELFKLYSFVESKTSNQDLQLVKLNKIDAKEMASILEMAFENPDPSCKELSLQVTPLASINQSLLISGTKSEINRAIKLIDDLEANIEDPEEKTLFWYTTKHSDAEELASILARVYDLLVDTPLSVTDKQVNAKIAEAKKATGEKKESLIVSPSKIDPGAKLKSNHKTADGQNNFIVDPKTGAIMMVVKQDALGKIKQLLKKLDVPKKMVQIEVLLFEKKMGNEQKFGLNLLKIGADAAKTMSSGLGFDGGILKFFLNRKKESGIPAYDLAYNFLLSQDDVQINASPSVTTMNQTPATFAIVEEISIDGGSDKKDNRIFNRAQYGITMKITPTINIDDDESDLTNQFITLETDITFDTTKKGGDGNNGRPDVTRRHIENHVRIGDGQTVILGGLRRKNQDDKKNSIPFLGEIPGLGKLFSSTELSENTTEMFIFITPKIISDPIEDAEKIKIAQLQKRAGDLPEFLMELDIAKDKQRKRVFQDSLTALFGRHQEGQTVRKSQGEYDGKS